jgi:hypothetical protein
MYDLNVDYNIENSEAENITGIESGVCVIFR